MIFEANFGEIEDGNQFRQLSYMAGKMEAIAEYLLDNRHTCADRYSRYPWPIDLECSACCRVVEKHAKRINAEIPLLLFGYSYLLESFLMDHFRRIEMAQARRDMGAYI